MSINIRELKEAVRHPYAFPGGYEVIFIANDGECLCHECVRNNWREVLDSTTKGINDGWRITGFATLGNTIEATEEEPLYCGHCNKVWN